MKRVVKWFSLSLRVAHVTRCIRLVKIEPINRFLLGTDGGEVDVAVKSFPLLAFVPLTTRTRKAYVRLLVRPCPDDGFRIDDLMAMASSYSSSSSIAHRTGLHHVHRPTYNSCGDK